MSSFYLQLLLFSGLAFFLMLGWLKRTLTITLDVDWLYRRLGVVLARRFDRLTETAWAAIMSHSDQQRAYNPFKQFDATTPRMAFSLGPCPRARWRSGRPSCWPPIWSCRICEQQT